jgi:hypothetical protein
MHWETLSQYTQFVVQNLGGNLLFNTGHSKHIPCSAALAEEQLFPSIALTVSNRHLAEVQGNEISVSQCPELSHRSRQSRKCAISLFPIHELISHKSATGSPLNGKLCR